MINVQGSNLNGFADGLEPLFNLQKMLSGVDEKLKSISSSDILETFSSFVKLQKTLSMLTPASDQLVSTVFEGLEVCDQVKRVEENYYKESKEVTKKVKHLATMYEALQSAVVEFNATKLRAEMDGLIASLGFKDLGKSTNQEEEVKAAVAVS